MKLEPTNSDNSTYGNKYHFYYHKENNTVVCTTLYKGQMVRGVAKCDPCDEFDVELGKKLAYLRCKMKFARKKFKRALQAERDALFAANRVQGDLDKACEFVNDSGAQLDDAICELRKFEAELNIGGGAV